MISIIQLSKKNWIVTLSYFTKPLKSKRKSDSEKPGWYQILESARQYREFVIDPSTGQVIAMRDPQPV